MPSLAYGASCEGSPQPIRRFVEDKMKAARAGSGPFRSATLNSALDADSSANRLFTAPLLAWAKEVWEGAVDGLLSRAWARAAQLMALLW